MVPEQESRLVSAGVHHGGRAATLPGAPVIREGEWRATSKRALDGRGVVSEHGIQGVIPCDLPTELVQTVTAVAKG